MPDSAIAVESSTRRRDWRAYAVTFSAIFLLLAAITAAVPWALRLPLPTTTDEAHYLKYLIRDHDRYAHGGARKWMAGIVFDDNTRPPAYRLGVGPWVTLIGVNFARMRLLSMAWLLVTAGIVGETVRRFTSSVPASAVAVAMAGLSTKVFLSTIHFGTEYVFYLGTALTYYGMLRDWDNPAPRRLSWLPLAIGLAVSALSKASFVALTLGPICVVAVLWGLGRVRGPGGWYLFKAIAVAVCLAGPWWIYNHRPAIDFAVVSVAFKDTRLGPALYLPSLCRKEIGLPIAILIGSAVFTVAVKWRPHRTRQTHLVLLMLLFPVLLLAAVQLFSPNQDGRLISHAFLPLAMAGGIALADLRWLKTTTGVLIVIAMLAWQTAMLAGPPGAVSAVAARVPVLAVSDRPTLHDWPTCDWEPLRALCARHTLPDRPSIAVVGYSNTFNSDQVQIPWALHDRDVKASQLGRPDAGPREVSSAVTSAKGCDVIVVATRLNTPENSSNAAIAAALAADPEFGPGTPLTVGTTEPVTTLVFFRR